MRLFGGVELPKKLSLNCTIPELVKSSVGSFLSTKGADGIILWPLFSKKSRNFLLIVPESIISKSILALIAIVFYYIYNFLTQRNHKINPLGVIKKGIGEIRLVARELVFLTTY